MQLHNKKYCQLKMRKVHNCVIVVHCNKNYIYYVRWLARIFFDSPFLPKMILYGKINNKPSSWKKIYDPIKKCLLTHWLKITNWMTLVLYTQKRNMCVNVSCQLSTYTIIHFFGGKKVLFHEDLQQCNNSLGI